MKRTHAKDRNNETGIAMITTLLVLMLMSALLVGFTTVVMSDQRYRFIDRDRGQAFYAASAGIEKLTADLGNLFVTNVAPTAAQVQALTLPARMPVIPGITFAQSQQPSALPASQLTDYHCIGRNPLTNAVINTKAPTPVGTNGYMVRFCALNATGNPTVSDDNLIVSTGAFAQMTALQTPYQIDVTAKTSTGGEVHLSRTIQAVAIPVFQFAIFSESDLSFFAGPSFTINGRVHTNGNLWLAQGPGNLLQINGRISALKDVMRQTLSNGNSIDNAPAWTGTVSLATNANAPTGNRNLLRTEGSVGNPAWQTISTGASPANYNSFLRNGTGSVNPPGTGAKRLNLPLTASGVTGCTIPGANTPPAAAAAPCTNVEIAKRPLAGEDVNGILYNERLFTKASIRILLSDTAADITSIPGVTGTAPVPLDGNWNAAPPVAGYTPITLNNVAPAIPRPPIALSPGPISVTSGNNTASSIVFASSAVAAAFKPRFVLATAPGTVITCTGKTTVSPFQLTGCTGVTAAPSPTLLTALSPASTLVGPSAATGPSAPISANVLAGATTIRFVDLPTLDRFTTLPFWDTGTAVAPANTLVTCKEYTTTTYTLCSSYPVVNSVLVSAAMSDPGVSTIGGYIKIERNNADGSGWTDITLEMLNYGIGGPNVDGDICADPTSNAIVRLQRWRDNPGGGGWCSTYTSDTTGAKDPTNWWPNVLFDPREGLNRDSNYPGANNLTLGGVMHYVNLDVANLARWFKHAAAPFNVAGSTGNLSKIDGTGFSVYFSDRRNNRNASARETGEYGYEDFVNPAVANGVPDGALQTGEDVNENGVLEVYGGVPNYTALGGVPAINAAPPCGVAYATCTGTYGAGYALNVAANPTTVLPARVAQVNRAILFRRALMLSNGAGIGANAATALTGLTIVSENPVYIKGNWNAETPAGSGFTGANAATSVIADAVSLLSNNWSDANSFVNPYNTGSRDVTANGWYRVAIVSGKGPSFALPTVGGGIAPDFGTDGGAHNFLRFLENWSGQTVNYLGSMATLYYNRQSVGTYKCCSTVYGAPGRSYNFDANFLNPALLPPLTPMFRDINVIGFSQELRPGR